MGQFVVDGILVSAGRVMSPEQVRASLASRPGMGRLVNGWYLCGDVYMQMYDKLVQTDGQCEMSLGVIPAEEGGNYALIGVDVSEFRHLFLLPLFELPVVSMLQSLRTQPLQLSLGRQNEDVAALIRMAVPEQQISEVLGYRQRAVELVMSDVFARGRNVLDRVRAVEAVESCGGRRRPEYSSVSFIMPGVALAACEQLAGQHADRRAVH